MDGQNLPKYIRSIMDNIFEKIPITTAPAVGEYLLLTQQPNFVRASKKKKYSTQQKSLMRQKASIQQKASI